MKEVLRKTIFAAIIFGAVFIAFSFSANAATFVVNTTADTQDAVAGDGTCIDSTGTCSLRAAITEANALAGADIITLPAGTYTETLVSANDNANAGGDYDITSDLTINGAGSGTTIVQANASPGVATERVFHVRFTGASTVVVINDVTVRNGRYANNTFGAGIRVDVGAANLTLNRVNVTGNLNASNGGGISASGAANAVLTINDSTISGNSAGSNVTGTSANGAGIHINNPVTVNVTNTTISNNISNNAIAASGTSVFGAGFFTNGGTATFTGCTISNNTATISGAGATGIAFAGGIYNQQATVSLINSTLNANSVTNTATPANALHAGIRTLAGTIAATTNITNSTISNSVSGGDGGGLTNITTNSAAATTNITDSVVSGNSATGASGGGILNLAATGTPAGVIAGVNITNSTIRNNTATFGAGIMNQITTSSVAGSAVITMNRSTVSNNISSGNGGGVYNISFSTAGGLSTVNATNSTISSNSGANGGGLTNEVGAGAAGATTNFNFVTVASNNATTSGGGLNQGGGTINLKNSIVADNTATTSGPDIFGTITSQDYNHVENTSGGTFFTSLKGKNARTETAGFMALPNDVTGVDPILAPLANNFGTTATHLPSGLSPVVNAIPNGVNDCGTTVAVDQRNFVRPQGGGCDKGATESIVTSAPAAISGRVVTADGRGIVNAVVTVTGGRLAQPITATTSSFGTYSVEGLPSGETYVVQVYTKRFVISNSVRVITLGSDANNTDFIAQDF
ncbi:MAG TPA: choice-of-anchor Q domain-containing protein [Pyrinomonadaceae bacterium]|nr:choice-of-anchor Q domain-containing protein [Pyrinomonadaceae bacterium]